MGASVLNVSLTLTLIKEPVRGVDVWGDDLADTLADQHHHQELNLAINVPEN